MVQLARHAGYCLYAPTCRCKQCACTVHIFYRYKHMSFVYMHLSLHVQCPLELRHNVCTFLNCVCVCVCVCDFLHCVFIVCSMRSFLFAPSFLLPLSLLSPSSFPPFALPSLSLFPLSISPPSLPPPTHTPTPPTGETLVCTEDPKRSIGLWHGVMAAAYNGLHVVYVPPNVMATLPTAWLHMIQKHKGRNQIRIHGLTSFPSSSLSACKTRQVWGQGLVNLTSTHMTYCLLCKPQWRLL